MAEIVPRGLIQSDVLIRAAVLRGIEELRLNPWMLSHIFAWLPQDELTQQRYGLKEVDQAREWFLAHHIEVKLAAEITAPAFPSVAISLMESAETENKLGDAHHESVVEENSDQPALCPAFDPVSYTQATGSLILPESVTSVLVVVPGMLVVDRAGNTFPILDVKYSTTAVEVFLAKGSLPDLHGAVIKGTQPASFITLESAFFRETYQLVCMANTSLVHLTYLHTIIQFVLMWGRQDLLEARGCSVSQLQSGEIRRLELEQGFCYARSINVSGTVMQVWPKRRVDTAYSLSFQPSVAAVGSSVSTFSGTDSTPEDESYLAQDSLGLP